MSEQHITPPKWAELFFNWYCRNELAESILGDMYERFYDTLERYGKFRAQLNFILNTFRFINKYTLRKQSKDLINHGGYTVMLNHHFLTTYRNLRRNKVYTLINIFGLTISIGSCLLIGAYLNNELSFDSFHENSNNIYRINHLLADQSGNITRMANTPPALIPGIRGVIPGIKKATRMRYLMRTLLEYGDKQFYETRGFYADSSFLKVFSFPLKHGNRFTALDKPTSVVITQEMAAKYFGVNDPIGNTLKMNGEIDLTVTGILESVPGNSHLQFDFLVSFPTYKVPSNYLSDLTSWSWAGFLSYVQLDDGTDPKTVQDNIDKIYSEQYPGSAFPNKSYVQPLQDIYLGSTDLIDDLASGMQSGNRFTIYSLGAVAVLILLIACFNFMNLSVAVSATRFKETGLRKMLGADRSSLAGQLLTESVMLALISLILAYGAGIVFFQYLKDALGWNFSISLNEFYFSLPVAAGIVLLVGIGAGIYPAIFLSGHKAVAALKNNMRGGSLKGSTLRKFLIGFQFCISISLIASTIIITKQYSYLSNQELGFDKENVAVIKLLPEHMSEYYDWFKETLLRSNHVKSVTQSMRAMGEPWPVNMISVKDSENQEYRRMSGNLVGYDYLETMGIKLLQGRSFSKDYSRDATNSVIINRVTADYLGLKNPVGQQVDYFSTHGPRTIIGVVEDFNFLSLHHKITPMCLILPMVDLKYIYVRFTPGNLTDKVNALTEVWNETIPGIPMDYRFMDDQLNRLYSNELMLSSLIFGFSTLAIILACMGLYGLISFSLNRSRKEMGIRKVLGASVSSLLIWFSKQYVILIIAASVIAVPVVQIVLGLWLEGFWYRIEITWWMYLISIIALLVIALLTISHKALSAALVNPVKVLKEE